MPEQSESMSKSKIRPLWRVMGGVAQSYNPLAEGEGHDFAVLYCGTSFVDALRAYMTSRPQDYCHGRGCQSRQTVCDVIFPDGRCCRVRGESKLGGLIILPEWNLDIDPLL